MGHPCRKAEQTAGHDDYEQSWENVKDSSHKGLLHCAGDLSPESFGLNPSALSLAQHLPMVIYSKEMSLRSMLHLDVFVCLYQCSLFFFSSLSLCGNLFYNNYFNRFCKHQVHTGLLRTFLSLPISESCSPAPSDVFVCPSLVKHGAPKYSSGCQGNCKVNRQQTSI